MAGILFAWIMVLGVTHAMPYCGETPACRVWCPFGYVRDEYGCALCQCLEAAPRSVGTDPCSPPVCLFFQPACDAYVKDDKGCDTCDCESQASTEVTQKIVSGKPCVPKPCPFYLPACGVYQKDESGCDTCDCSVAIRDIVGLPQHKSAPAFKEFDP